MTDALDAVGQEWGSGYVDAATSAIRISSAQVFRHDDAGMSSSGSVTPQALREAMGCFATGVCVVTTCWEGDDVAMTANSVTSVSLDPPMILVCVARAARFHEAITTAAHWGVSILDASSYDLSSHFARPSRDRRRQLADISFVRGPQTGVALLSSSVARVECTTSAAYPAGDHTILVGAVESVSTSGSGASPLLFHRGRYRWLLP